MKNRMRAQFRHGDLLSLILLLAVSLALWAFVELANQVVEGDVQRLDERVLALFRTPGNPADAVGPSWLENMFRIVSALGSELILTPVVAFAVIALWMEGLKRAAVWLGVAAAGAGVLSPLFKNYFARERPAFLVKELLPASSSFPSGHALLSMAVYLTIGALLTQVVPAKRTKAIVLLMAVLIALLIGVSRVYLGFHYPSDVLAGWCLGLFWATLCWLVAWTIRDRK